MQASEREEQKALVLWLQARSIRHVAVPNGATLAGGPGERARQWRSLEAQGCQRGFPDLLVLDKPPLRPECCGVAIELKRREGGSVSADQVAWLERLEQLGWVTLVAHGAEEACKYLVQIGYPRGKSTP